MGPSQIARATAAVTIAALAAGCGANADLPPPSADTGSVALNFGIAHGLSISAFDYAISSPSAAVGAWTGRLDVADANASVSGVIGGLPPGAAYELSLSATTDDGGTFCGADSVFDVVAGSPTSLVISMVCLNANTTRTIEVDGVAHVCPLVASSTLARTGDAITLSASSYSFDELPIGFLWEASAGVLTSPNERASAYECGPGGVQEVRVTVSDGKCDDLALLDVGCPGAP
jgi:hypothetical protein